MNIQDIKQKAEALVKANKLWRDPTSRRRFENETGLAPIIFGNGLDVEAQHQSGQTETYSREFMNWAALQA